MLASTTERLATFTEKVARALDFGRKGTGDLSDAVLVPLVEEANAICADDASIENVFCPDDDYRLKALRADLSDIHEDQKRLAAKRAKSMLVPALAFESHELELAMNAEQITKLIRQVEAEIDAEEDE